MEVNKLNLQEVELATDLRQANFLAGGGLLSHFGRHLPPEVCLLCFNGRKRPAPMPKSDNTPATSSRLESEYKALEARRATTMFSSVVSWSAHDSHSLNRACTPPACTISSRIDSSSHILQRRLMAGCRLMDLMDTSSW